MPTLTHSSAPAGQVFDKWQVTAQTTPPIFDNQFSMTAHISGSNYGSVTITVSTAYAHCMVDCYSRLALAMPYH